MDQHNVSGVMSSRNESQQAHHGNSKLIGKNSLHMKRRSEYPDHPANSSNQWHLPDAKSGSSAVGIITSESTKSTGAHGFNFQKHQQTTPTAAWHASASNGGPVGVVHSQSQGGVSQTSGNQKRVIN